MIWDPWQLVLVRTAGGRTAPVRVWLPPLPGAPPVGAELDQPETGSDRVWNGQSHHAALAGVRHVSRGRVVGHPV